MPRWLVTEFARHRKWLATPENWAYEIKENEFELRDVHGNKLTFEDFPMFLEVVLRKTNLKGL